MRHRQRRNELESRTKLLALAEEEFHLLPDSDEAGPVIVNNYIAEVTSWLVRGQ